MSGLSWQAFFRPEALAGGRCISNAYTADMAGTGGENLFSPPVRAASGRPEGGQRMIKG